MSKFTLNLTGQKVQDSSSGGNDFKPLPQGTYAATIYDVKEGEYGSESNKGRPKFDVQVRISEGEYANRRLFTHVPLFLEWGSGADAFAFYDFFGPFVTGDPKSFRAHVKELVESGEGELDLPTPNDLLGREVEVHVKVVPDNWKWRQAQEENPDAKLEDFNRNEIASFKLPDKSGSKPAPGKFTL